MTEGHKHTRQSSPLLESVIPGSRINSGRALVLYYRTPFPRQRFYARVDLDNSGVFVYRCSPGGGLPQTDASNSRGLSIFRDRCVPGICCLGARLLAMLMKCFVWASWLCVGCWFCHLVGNYTGIMWYGNCMAGFVAAGCPWGYMHMILLFS